jgi:ion channel-forming bestrophin family protein
MHAGRHYTAKEIFFWTLRETFVFVTLGALPPLLVLGGVQLPELAWPPVALLGTAVAFITGFKGNAAYNRAWEARQIWGGIVNASRIWASSVAHLVALPAAGGSLDGDAVAASKRALIFRHLGWLTALRFQLREGRVWETQDLPHNRAYQQRTFDVAERSGSLETELSKYLPAAEVAPLLPKKNRAILLLGEQSAALRTLADQGALTELRHVELERCLATLIDLQGRCERIKNFPYPRQFATLNLIFVWMFIVTLPFALIGFFDASEDLLWINVPATVAIAWVLHTMDKISEATENPFEGGPNDVPITAMSRGIEIDLRELGELGDVPPPLTPVHNILM